MTQVFSCEFCEISKNTFLKEHLWTTASDSLTIEKTLLNFENCDFYLKTWTKHLKNTCGGVNLIMFQVFSPQRYQE